ncbi:filamentous hemagglutinin N-terminal domain-containing protein [Methylomonas sp. LW13]|uniref:filamentous haemagglutinin family protein n=1 Tax=unclassified Methylomonas TaxID=2608980 RepID=UPI00051BF408|nr:filamentous haemagglutinin family protein [Methylomonas sp. LW13]QBC29261.1 filamentous hemagglutinin N-terminal domain-containing protein [Methylomonas sp. LW13]
MNTPITPFTGKEPLLRLSIRRILTGGVLAISSVADSWADGGLPVSINAGGANPSALADLTSAARHPGINVGHASANYSADGQKLTIHQTTDKTVLDWQSFNIDAGKSVQFAQPTSSSVALNNIHQLDASKISGTLSANGQVYLVNANGFVFGNGASVNTNSLVATNLKIADEVFAQGISKVVDANASANNKDALAALAGDGTVYRNTGNGNREKIRILVEAGAQIGTGSGGRVIMAAPQVENRGTISAPDGQVILAAATDKVYLQETDDDNLRGLLVEVKTGGDVKNLGKILTERGNTTLMGFAVTQQGVISASTSVALNGSVRLLAREGARLEAGDNRYRLKPLSTSRTTAADDGLGTEASVTLESGSLTTATLDASAGGAVSGQAQPKSKIDLQAGQIRLKSAAQIVAHGGDVSLTASATPANPLSTSSADNTSRIVLAAGSKIDVSGVKNIELPMSANIVDVELRNNELRDAPLQKTGFLHGKTVQVDSRTGTTLADISGALEKVQHSIEERNLDAGSVHLQSEGDVIVQPGADIEISGGSIHYLAGKITTSKLRSNSSIVDIASADPNLTYQQILNSSYYQSDYYQGGDAGSLIIKTRDLGLSGNILAGTVNSAYQRTADKWVSGGALRIDTTWSNQYQQDLVFSNGAGYAYGAELDTAVPIYLSSGLFAQGVNRLTVSSGGKLTIPQNTRLSLAKAGSLSLQAGEIEVLGNIQTPTGNVELKTRRGLDPTRDLSGRLHLAAGSVIDSSGSWINDLVDSKNAQILKPLTIDGGNILLQAQGDLLLDGGSKISASAGAALNNNTKTKNGHGGNIDLISAGLDPSVLSLGAIMSAYALQQGGVLSITANGIQLGGASGDPHVLNLSPALLQSGGFSGYRLTANAGDLNIADGTQIHLQQSNWQLKATAIKAASGSDLSTLVQLAVLPDDIRDAVDLSLNLSHNASIAGGYVAERAIRIGSHTAIIGDPGADFSLKSDANIYIDGSLLAPAGKISLQLSSPPSALDKGYNPNQAIALGHNAILNTAGATVWTTNAQRLALGNVLAGGRIDLNAERGYILTAAGSRMDVSGTQSAIDIVNAKGKSRQTLASAGGSINLTAAEGMLLQGQLQGRAGQGTTAAGSGSAAAGGTLKLELNTQHRGEPEEQIFTTGDRVIHFSAELPNLPDAAQLAANGIPDTFNGQAYISARQIQEGGFGSLGLAASVIQPDQYSATPVRPERGEIRFEGDLSLTLAQNLKLDAPLISHAGYGQVALTSNTFSLGSSWNRAAHGNLGAAIGSVGLSINAQLIDLFGSSEIAGFAQTSLNSSGDIRLTGINPNSEADLIGGLSLSGNLSLSARQIYPTTLSKYSLKLDAALNPNGLIDILPGIGNWYTPLSAVGQLNINAPNIVSHGVLLAPFGNIALNAGNSLTLAAGSFTSVSDDDGIVIPFGRTQGGLDWIYPLGTYNNIQNGTPQKAITLSAPDINLAGDAVVNLNGGGDLSAFEFIAGPGGSIDTLDPTSPGYQQNYAVLPNYQADFVAFDPLEFAKSGLNLGDSIFLSANSGLAAGYYLLLPAHYALLPGAYLITPQANTTDMAAGTKSLRTDGSTIVAGYRYSAGTNIADSRWSGFAVESGAISRTRSEYQETTTSNFFAGNSLPQDAGNLSLLAGNSLQMAAQISATAAPGGLGGMLDISADRLAVVSSRSIGVDPGTVLLADELNRLGVDSLLLGGRRSRGNGQTQLTVGAQTVTVAAGSRLQAPEILLAASDTVSLAGDTTLSNAGTISRTDTNLKVINTDGSSDGALLRVSAGSQANVVRAADALTGLRGTLDIADGATLSSAGSILLDASKDTRFSGNIAMNQGELTLSSSRISLGDTGGSDGLQLSAATLNGLRVDKLTLNSFGAIDIAGAMNLQLKDLVLNAASLYGYGSSNQIAAINAETITLKNSGSAPTAFTAAGNGQLNLTANTITLGAGEYAWSGFQQISLQGLNAVVNSGTADIRADSDVTIATPIWTATAGANSSLNLGSHDLTTLAAGTAPQSDALGARLSVAAEQINHQGHIELASGIVKLQAAQTLSISGSIDTSGRDIDLAGHHVNTGGGSIFLKSAGGSLTLNAGSLLDVSGSQLGGDAGTLSLSSGLGHLTLTGEIRGLGYQGARGGNINMDATTSSGATFSVLNNYLTNAGFNGDWSIRQRSGDLTVAASDYVKAHNLNLSVDTGKLDVFGTLDVGDQQAGSIRLSAGDSINILACAKLNAASTAAGKPGGSVVISSMDADNDGDHGVTVATGANIDVSGGAGGSVEAVVNRFGNGDAAVSIASGSVLGAHTLNVSATAHYRDIPLSNSQIGAWRGETQQYLNAAAANADLQQRLGGFSLQAGVDIVSSGDLTLDLTESLTGMNWTQQSSSIWKTSLTDAAGVVNALQQIGSNGVVRNLTEAASSSLTADGTYYFDANPQSATFRTLFVRIFPNAGAANIKYKPSNINGSLISHNGWDLAFPDSQGRSWHFDNGNSVGALSVRAAGKLHINQTLSDGFALYDSSQLAGMLGVNGNWLRTLVLQTGQSWNYNLVAGADLTSADPLAVQSSLNAGSLTVAANTSVRTGTGNINVAAASDITLSDATSTIYTAGRAADTERWGNFSNALVAAAFFVEYPFDGGDVSLNAGGNVIGAASPQLMSDWLQRTGNWDASDGISAADRATAWGIMFDGLVVQNSANARIQNLKFGFRENIGALGGGDVSIKAGADIHDLSVMLPTSAKPVGVTDNGLVVENRWQLQGGGNLEVHAGGDIAGGVFYVDKGTTDIRADGAITGGSQYTAGPVFALGDAQFQVQAASGIDVGTVLNPFSLTPAKFLDKTSYFSSYSADSAIELQTLAGNLVLNNDVQAIVQAYKIFDQASPMGRAILKSTDYPLLTLYPGNLHAQALSGGLEIVNSMTLYPAAESSLNLLANGDISIGNDSSGTRVNQLDVDPARLQSAAQPATTVAGATKYLFTTPFGGDASTVHAPQPIHRNDTSRNRIVSANGSITGIGDALVAAAKSTDIWAGQDLYNLSLAIQNINAGDVTSISIGRDLVFPILRDPTTGTVQGSPGGIQLAGPGLLNIWAGRNVDLGSSEGITTVGPLLNSALPQTGADIIVIAGSSLQHDTRPLEDFLNDYVANGAYQDRLAELNLQTTTAGRLAVALDILFTEIRATAVSAASLPDKEKAAAYQRGYAAIARLFPSSPSGGIRLFFSRIQTLYGGDIDLLAPGGMINVGLASAFTGQKSQDQLGVVAQREGDVNILVNGDLQVNRSRIFTLDGGDITAWSSEGNIDAGRGAKSAISTPKPKVSLDANGNLVVVFPATVSGSGIRAQSGFNRKRIGNVYLLTPRGYVDAGEAGIGGGKVILPGQVRGVDNIQIANPAPAPAAQVSNPMIAGDAAAAAAAKSAAGKSFGDEEETIDKRAKKARKVAVLDSQVVGFGKCSITDVRNGIPGCGG